MKKLTVACGLLFLLALFGVGVWLWFNPYVLMPSVTVGDVRQAETLVLGQNMGSPYTYAITIQGRGEVDGEATIALLLHGQPYKVAKLSGKVDFEWGGDWYSETAEVRYEPANVKSGIIVLYYRFHH